MLTIVPSSPILLDFSYHRTAQCQDIRGHCCHEEECQCIPSHPTHLTKFQQLSLERSISRMYLIVTSIQKFHIYVNSLCTNALLNTNRYVWNNAAGHSVCQQISIWNAARPDFKHTPSILSFGKIVELWCHMISQTPNKNYVWSFSTVTRSALGGSPP